MMQDSFVLLITDRQAQMRGLASGVERMVTCTCLPPGASLPEERPLLVIVDVDEARPDNAAAIAALTQRTSAGAVPCLTLLRNAWMREGRTGDLPENHRVLPATTPRDTILAKVLEMITVAARACSAKAQRLEARAVAATGVVTDMFFTAAAGAPLRPAEADRGTETVLDAISETGIRAWLEIIWKHDAQVYQHTLSVAGYAAAFGNEIALSRDDHHRLTKAALLHDIGKSKIPAAILNKPGGLTRDEMALMRDHAALGADLLIAQGGFEPEIIDVVRHHHEKLDGSGYPDALAGSAITDLVRIVTICDIFSALTERRAYRAPLGITEAVTVMTGMRGELDRTLMHAFAPIIARTTATDWL
ncbi:HD-GYP domain-containing protein [Methylobacterium planeticum]|uniref:HD domain-containing protein n=1 Tax=Methylobacterium planeticum TaxID=2615211 RepID=A0A6N6MWE7_9HYPH|nr:HD domain-containing phosphohydrolase [Methylobacterium planeticum]KAB1073349.1 HD domain-containing protein [Methylobacterium planeticum]